MTFRPSNEEVRRLGLGYLLTAADVPKEKKRKSKYGNITVETDDLKFDSKKEERHYRKLKVKEKAGLIKDLQHHVVFELAPSVKYSTATKAKPAIRYEADFVYIKNGKKVIEDVKSAQTAKNQVYILKKHLMMWRHGIEVMEV